MLDNVLRFLGVGGFVAGTVLSAALTDWRWLIYGVAALVLSALIAGFFEGRDPRKVKPTIAVFDDRGDMSPEEVDSWNREWNDPKK